MSKRELTCRSYIVCHMISALDGRIDGQFFNTEKMSLIREASEQIRTQLNCEAVICGATTTAEFYAEGFIKEQLNNDEKYVQRTDYVASYDDSRFYVSIDPCGCIQWKENYVEKGGCPRSHVIEVLTEDVSDYYIAYLRSLNISYIFAGENSLDCSLLLKKLKQKFKIQRVMLSGGGVTNWAFLKAGMIDEISLVLCPVAEGNRNSALLFEQSQYMSQDTPETFALANVQTLPGDALWLIYHPENCRKGREK